MSRQLRKGGLISKTTTIRPAIVRIHIQFLYLFLLFRRKKNVEIVWRSAFICDSYNVPHKVKAINKKTQNKQAL